MKYLISIILLFPFLIFSQLTSNLSNTTEQINKLKTAKIFSVEVKQSYLGDDIKELPFKEVAESLFGMAGLRKPLLGSEVSDLTISIRAKGNGLSVETSSGTLYNGVSLSGHISIFNKNNEIIKKTFKVIDHYPLPEKILPGWVHGRINRPSREEYLELFNSLSKTESFRSVIIQLISEAFGSAALLNIMQGRDFINREYARIELTNNYDSSIIASSIDSLKDPYDKINLTSMIGRNFNEDEIQEWISSFYASLAISKFKDSHYYNFKSKGLSLRFNNKNILTTIFVYSDNASDYQQYRGVLPFKLSLANTRNEIEDILGNPEKSGGGGTMKYWVQYNLKGIGVTYNSKNANDLSAGIHHIAILSK